MEEKLKQEKNVEKELGGRLESEVIEKLLEQYGRYGLELDSEHSEYFKFGNTRVQKLKHFGGKKSIEDRIQEIVIEKYGLSAGLSAGQVKLLRDELTGKRYEFFSQKMNALLKKAEE